MQEIRRRVLDSESYEQLMHDLYIPERTFFIYQQDLPMIEK
jgi:hypothetical protein